MVEELAPSYRERRERLQKRSAVWIARATLLRQGRSVAKADRLDAAIRDTAAPAHQLAWIAFVDILVFFGVLLVGFAYLWRRGDLDWVRSTAAERAAEAKEASVEPPASGALVGAGRGS